MKIKLALYFFVLITSLGISQNQKNKPLDSLKILSTSQIGKEKFNTLLNIAKIYAGINLDSSKIYTNQAFHISEAINNDSLKIKALLALGFRSFESADYTNAIKNFEKALPISFLIKDSTSMADIYNGFAIAYSKKGDLNKSIEYNFKTLSIYEKLKDSLGIGNSYLNIAWDYRNLKEFDKSLKYNLLSLDIYTKINNALRIAMANNNIAGTQNELGNYNKAIEYSKNSRNYFLELNYKRFTAYPISVMAVAYDSLKNYQLAEKNYLEAIQLHTEKIESHMN